MLRNVALTAPYMHNGAFETLDLHLSREEMRALVAFLGALTNTARIP